MIVHVTEFRAGRCGAETTTGVVGCGGTGGGAGGCSSHEVSVDNGRCGGLGAGGGGRGGVRGDGRGGGSIVSVAAVPVVYSGDHPLLVAQRKVV